MKIKLLLGIVSLFTVFTLAACGSNQEEPNATEGQDTDHSEMNHSDMSHSSSGVIPAGLKEADNPTYPVESKGILKADHMNGMKDAEATIVGAYNTLRIPIAAVGLLAPLAGATMTFSSVSVVLNALRLQGVKLEK